jgi:hypothetical protein
LVNLLIYWTSKAIPNQPFALRFDECSRLIA